MVVVSRQIDEIYNILPRNKVDDINKRDAKNKANVKEIV